MTRDEAISKFQKIENEASHAGAFWDSALRASTFVDTLIALDILKVDEQPVPARTRAVAILRDTLVRVHSVVPETKGHLQGSATAGLSGMSAVHLVDVLEAAGLAIVRKEDVK